MKKIVFIWLMGLACFTAAAQYNNGWIDYAKTYYKFKVGTTGLYRITQGTLAAAGLGNTPAEQFQLWRNGQQVAIYTSVATGGLPGGGYIEFWGERNDGKPDAALYKNPANQLSNALSLETDTATYFLTVNPAGSNIRITDAGNNVAGNTLPSEPYFMYEYRVNFQQNINYGYAVYYGEYVYSSTYDVGEFWSTNDIYPGAPYSINAGNLFAVAGGPSAKLQLGVAGNSYLGRNNSTGQVRKVVAAINGTQVINNSLGAMDAAIFNSGDISPSLLTGASVNLSIQNTNTWGETNDRIAASFISLTYPRQFNFGGASNFAFGLAATNTGYYLEITNFNAAGSTPVLYDLTGGKRYTANTATAGVLKFVLPAFNSRHSLVLVSEAASNIGNVTGLQQRNFINFGNTANQGDYIIITNKIFMADDNVAGQYAGYRGSVAGGSYHPKVYDIDELVDQFAFGIKKHPLSIKNFLAYARRNFSIKPKFCLLIGKAVTYNEYRLNESSRFADQLNLVPTFGWPASDNLLASDDYYPLPATPIGRIAAIKSSEVLDYLDKIKTYEQAQNDTTAVAETIDNKAWMKTMIHIVGANSDPGLDQTLTDDENRYKNTISGPLYGANVYSFNTTSVTSAPAADALLTKLFANGISVLNYFGHSASTTLDYNLSRPDQHPNPGKYPLFVVNGCNAGNIYSFDTTRVASITSLSELFVLAKNLGAIGFLASTHFGVDTYLDVFNDAFYRNLASPEGYNHPVSTNIMAGLNTLVTSARYADSVSFLLHAEESVLHGDPALKINAQPRADFAVEDPQVSINPSFISVADNSFTIKAAFYNLGSVPPGDSVSVLITRKYPDGSSATLLSKRLPVTKYIDSISVAVPVVPTRDKGQNSITVSIDADQQYAELSEMNNSVTKQFVIYEDELTPVYPYNFAIVSKNNIKLVASTANPVMPAQQYAMELDTTELFNSPAKINKTVTSVGGEIEFDPSTTFTDSTVYYWRVAPVPASGPYHWNTSSFVYIGNGGGAGFNQSHLYQHLKSSLNRIELDSTTRAWSFDKIVSLFNLTNTVYDGVPGSPQSAEDAFAISINNKRIASGACLGHSIIFNVFNPLTLQPLYNQASPSTTGTGTYGGFMGSAGTCSVGTEHAGTQFDFEFAYNTMDGRNKMAAFMAWVPAGYIVSARVIINKPYNDPQTYAPTWKNDPLVNNTNLYYSLKNAGFAALDDYTFARAWIFLYRKNSNLLTPSYAFTPGLTGVLDTTLNISSADTLGYITSPQFGPAKAWKQVKWRGNAAEAAAGDAPVVSVIGIAPSGAQTVLYNLTKNQQDFDISSVSTAAYPNLMLRMRNADSINLTPYQLRYWRVLYDAMPEGALAPNILYKFSDTLGVGQTSNIAIAFKNVSDVPFADSIQVKMVLYNAGNVANVLPAAKLKVLQPGDTATINYTLDSKTFSGLNNFYLDINPGNAQPEQYHFNNFLYRNIFVQDDNLKPTLDVTFDGVHILNNDIVSAKPHVLIKLKDESKYLLLDDTSVLSVQLMYPNGTLRKFTFNTDTVRFTPATPGTADNTAQVDFSPYLTDDGIYTLYVHGKDKTGNPAGSADYSVSFEVYNKPMITNMFNYPNPFTTSTAFVFTLTGSQVPQNIRIQILTITGKIVREITSTELGPLHIGRNITTFKWDGTDQYGQKLANGVYLYRVLTNLNGHSLDKFSTLDANGDQVNTDKYF
ncbi:MAG TPA: C25 family cysteine peptidase, partial [Chitinophagaceae bacterium]|nr:C25 family cysteine peptidase [Chitinophagaceae bacterium]